MDQLLVWCSGLAGVLSAAFLAWRWRALPLVHGREAPEIAGPPGRGDGPRTAAIDGLRVVATSLWAGLVAGLLVPGLGGRLLMRITAATSPAQAQGRLTEAGEVVGEITLGGTVGFLIFVGLTGGVVTAIAHPFVRRWLPRTAGRAGIVLAVPLLGLVGVSDPLSPQNRDFTLLEPVWLAVALVVGIALLFGVTFTALAARLDAALPPIERRPAAVAAHLSLVLLIVPPVAVGAAVYVGGRALLAGRSLPLVRHERASQLARVVVAVVVAVTGVRTLGAAVEILGG